MSTPVRSPRSAERRSRKPAGNRPGRAGSARHPAFRAARRHRGAGRAGLWRWACTATLSLETLVRHRTAIDRFVAEPCRRRGRRPISRSISRWWRCRCRAALIMTHDRRHPVRAGDRRASPRSSARTIGATLIFLIARSAAGERLMRRAGPLAAQARRRLPRRCLQLSAVPAAGAGLSVLSGQSGAGAVRRPAARPSSRRPRIGIIPATFAFAVFGAGLDSVIAAQEAAYNACLAAGRADCRLDFDLSQVADADAAAGARRRSACSR